MGYVPSTPPSLLPKLSTNRITARKSCLHFSSRPQIPPTSLLSLQNCQRFLSRDKGQVGRPSSPVLPSRAAHPRGPSQGAYSPGPRQRKTGHEPLRSPGTQNVGADASSESVQTGLKGSGGVEIIIRQEVCTRGHLWVQTCGTGRGRAGALTLKGGSPILQARYQGHRAQQIPAK